MVLAGRERRSEPKRPVADSSRGEPRDVVRHVLELRKGPRHEPLRRRAPPRLEMQGGGRDLDHPLQAPAVRIDRRLPDALPLLVSLEPASLPERGEAPGEGLVRRIPWNRQPFGRAETIFTISAAST